MLPALMEQVAAGAATDYRMIDAFRVSNFKCFQDIELHGLRSVNVLVGESGSGKTSLLEAMFLAAGLSSELYIRTQSWRGSLGDTFAVSPQVVVDEVSLTSLFGELFHGFDTSRTAHLEILDSQMKSSFVDISYVVQPTEQSLIPSDSQPSPSTVQTLAQLTFRGQDIAGNHYDAPAIPPNVSGTVRATRPIKSYPMALFTPSNIYALGEAGKRYSQLSIRNQEVPVLKALQRLFPQVRALSLESPAGRQVLYATVDGLPSKIPIASLSGGLNKFLTILLAIAAQRNGVVAIDEVENGFYFKQAPKIWGAIVHACYEANVQLFVTTHSYEFLEATLPSVAEAPDRFSLMHVRNQNGSASVEVVEGRRYEKAIRQRFEVR